MENTQTMVFQESVFDNMFKASINEGWIERNEYAFKKMSKMDSLRLILEDQAQEQGILGKNHVFLNYLISGVTKSLNYGAVFISGLTKITLRKIKKDGEVTKESNANDIIKNTTSKMLNAINEIKVKIEQIEDEQLDMLVNDLVSIITIVKILGDTLISTASILINNQTQSRLTSFIQMIEEFISKLNEYTISISQSETDEKKFNLKDLTDYIEKSRRISSNLMSPIIPDSEAKDESQEEQRDDSNDYKTPPLGVPGETNESQVMYRDKYYITKIPREELPYYDPIRSPSLFTEHNILEMDGNDLIFELNDMFKSDNELSLTKDTPIEEAREILKAELEDVFDCFTGISNKEIIEKSLSLKLESPEDIQNIIYRVKEKLNG